ncbi:TPA: glycosyltransferase family 2 protein [Escherichia coli]|uniref:glycosyltransferase family 2 protein n=1 Tax=Escherichia coli TaxID=562 RepID=UPI000BDE8B0E|nr:glycosyltransferase family 2 protein [Escherichia coli]EEZ5923859.1 glycosyltransferase family 2 protein [Escherichia coli O102]EIA6182480.1 glycosyltransferase family 2 protein [Escherichia coli]MBB8394847.1 glycosyltransferase family 2 protein [Escherichia coli]MBB9445229.1 glycosyltransferase family 2 protein [Escherichia coli]MBC0639963.1 glycosyltransferase family 2 protein [Escherichia coli]
MVKNHQDELLAHFDEHWYLHNYLDVKQTGLSAREHFKRYGMLLGRKPCEAWDVSPAVSKMQNTAVLPYLATNQLSIDIDNSQSWVAEGNDPFFIIDLEQLSNISKGWYQFNISINCQPKQGLAKLYLDTGKGFNEFETVTLPYKRAVSVSRLFYLESPLVALRFDPLEQAAKFAINQFEIAAVDVKVVEPALLARIQKEHQSYRDMPLEKIKKSILVDNGDMSIERLQAFYNETFSVTPSSVGYEEWIETVELPSLPGNEEVSLMLASMTHPPVISIVIPVYNPAEIYLRACLDSVLVQSYPHWELCIADDRSPKEHVQRVLREYEAKDSRIKVVYRKHNGHISAASNSALEIAKGDFVALLDHDDVLPEHAMLFMAQAICEQPHTQILYSDEDKINARGERFDPHFKSDWNPDLFFSQNYVSHLGVYRRSLLQQIGGFRLGVEGSQDQDLLLRCLPHVAAEQIVHIPRVLYHWRTIEGSTALASGEKSYTTEAGIKALRDYFSKQQPEVTVEAGLVPNTYRVRYPISEPAPLVSLLIPTRDRRALTETAVRSIVDCSTYTHFEILILDNGSVEQETLDFFAQIQQEDSRVRVLRYDHPFNYSAINNFGVRHAKGAIIGLVNNDIEVINPDWLTEMVSHCMRPEIGCVGAKLYYSNDTIQHGGVILGIGGVAGHSHKQYPRHHPGYFSRLLLTQNLSAVTAACLLIRKNIYEEVAGLDEENLHVAFNDVDFCLKVREAGYRNLWTPYAELYHYESISRGAEDSPEKLARFAREVNFMKSKWGKHLELDPFYSPNLTKSREDFSI